MLNYRNFLHKFLCLLAITMVLPSSFAFGQKKGTKPVASKCSGAWTGTVTYMRRHTIKDDKKTPRISNGVDEREFRMTYEYAAKVLVTEATANDTNNIAKAKVDMTMTSREKTEAKKKKIRATAERPGRKCPERLSTVPKQPAQAAPTLTLRSASMPTARTPFDYSTLTVLERLQPPTRGVTIALARLPHAIECVPGGYERGKNNRMR